MQSIYIYLYLQSPFSGESVHKIHKRVQGPQTEVRTMALELGMMLTRLDRLELKEAEAWKQQRHGETMFRGKELYQMQVERPSQMGSGPGEVKAGGCGRWETLVQSGKHLNFEARHT